MLYIFVSSAHPRDGGTEPSTGSDCAAHRRSVAPRQHPYTCTSPWAPSPIPRRMRGAPGAWETRAVAGLCQHGDGRRTCSWDAGGG